MYIFSLFRPHETTLGLPLVFTNVPGWRTYRMVQIFSFLTCSRRYKYELVDTFEPLKLTEYYQMYIFSLFCPCFPSQLSNAPYGCHRQPLVNKKPWQSSTSVCRRFITLFFCRRLHLQCSQEKLPWVCLTNGAVPWICFTIGHHQSLPVLLFS